MFRAYNFDADTELHDGAAAISSDGSGQLASSDREIEVGAARFEAVAVLNVTACDDADGTETYRIKIRGAAATGMGSPVELASIEVVRGETGRFELPFVNVRRDTVYPFIDLYVDVGGDSPSITFKAHLAEICWG